MNRRRRIPGMAAPTRTLLVLPPIDDDLDPDLKNAIAIRNACATEGRCPCCHSVGEVRPDAEHEWLVHYVFAHEPWCQALTDEEAA